MTTDPILENMEEELSILKRDYLAACDATPLHEPYSLDVELKLQAYLRWEKQVEIARERVKEKQG